MSSARPLVERLEDRTVPSIGPSFPIAATAQLESEAVSAGGAGDSAVVVWTRRTDSSSPGDLFAQRYDKDGNPTGGVITVASTAADESGPAVAMDASGGFVVVWTHEVSNNGNFDVLFARYNAAGVPIASGPVAAAATRPEGFGQVGMRSTGEFVVACTRGDTFGTPGADADLIAVRFSAQGAALGTVKVAARADRQEVLGRIDMADGGKFAVSYLRGRGAFSFDPEALNGTQELFVRRFAANGKGLGTPVRLFRVNTDRTLAHDVGIDNQGNVAVVHDRGISFGTGNDNVTLRRVLRTGVVKSPVALASLSDFEGLPRIAVDRSDGDFVVTYQRTTDTSDNAVLAEFSRAGAIKDEHVLGDGTFTLVSDVSLTGLDRFFVVYTLVTTLQPLALDVDGAFGTLD